jgi:hypothetical protein
MWLFRLLRDPNPAGEGGGGNPTPGNPDPTPPPAGKEVIEGDRTERETQLQAELDAEREAKKKLEMDNAGLQDRIHTMTEQQKDAAWKYRPFKL